MKANELISQIKEGLFDKDFIDLYVDEQLLAYQRHRYIQAIETYISLYGNNDIEIYSAPGRSEVGGNHTDHQHGQVLAAAINLDIIAVVSQHKDIIKVVSDEFDIDPIHIHDVAKRKEEVGTSEALIRGIVSKLKELGYHIDGFQGYFTSDVLLGAGLSSSAAFEVIIGTILSGLYNKMNIDPVDIAKIGQYAENVFFEKPCGLMDQCASAVGGLINIDFKDPKNPVVKEVNVDFSHLNHSLCIVDALGSHADLTEDYASIPQEMKSVANYFGQDYLRDIKKDDFISSISLLRERVSDRAIARSLHFFGDHHRVYGLVEALEHHDIDTFKLLIKDSGHSSFKYLQNVYSTNDVDNQCITIALAMSEELLGDYGVCRVHGGGFAGTIQAFVEDSYVDQYKEGIEKVFGEHCCHILKIRNHGGIKVFPKK